MAAVREWFAFVVGISCCLKLLLIPSYRSTDFEVHRNWLAITHSLPISDWYYEETSKWTLDYPPFFAWFEFALSHFAGFFDEEMLVVTNIDYASRATIVFQRLSVIVTDLILIYAVWHYIKNAIHEKDRAASLSSKAFVFTVLVLLNFGLFVVDHIHFQYNGFMFGILLLSISKISLGQNLQGAFLFAVLLNFKHIFLYIAPAYFVYLLREYCFDVKSPSSKMEKLLGVNMKDVRPTRLVILAMVVLSVFLVSLGPFIWMGDLGQLLSRLFPVNRGLCHAYWAANFWVFYNVADKVLVMLGSKLGLIDASIHRASMTGGMVAQQQHLVLPSISPMATALITVVAMLPALLRIWYRPSGPRGFVRCLVLCAYCSFLFGYHVHEKAIIMVIIPLCILAVQNQRDCRAFLLLSIPGHFALFPLLYESFETPLKVTLFLAFTVFSCLSLANLHSVPARCVGLPFLNCIEACYIWGLFPLYLYTSVIHYAIGLESSLPFLPLMLTSLYCTIGVFWSWVRLYLDSFNPELAPKKIN